LEITDNICFKHVRCGKVTWSLASGKAERT
jgi:hypothetical protein